MSHKMEGIWILEKLWGWDAQLIHLPTDSHYIAGSLCYSRLKYPLLTTAISYPSAHITASNFSGHRSPCCIPIVLSIVFLLLVFTLSSLMLFLCFPVRPVLSTMLSAHKNISLLKASLFFKKMNHLLKFCLSSIFLFSELFFFLYQNLQFLWFCLTYLRIILYANGVSLLVTEGFGIGDVWTLIIYLLIA